MRSIVVKTNKEKVLLSKFIFDNFPSLSKNIFFKALRNKDIKINSKRISEDVFINNMDLLEIYISDTYLFNLPKKLDIIYEDNNLLIVFKKQGILSNNEDLKNKIFEPTLEDLVKNYYKDAFICHRLDRNTAGMVIFCKNNLLYQEMFNAFKNSNIIKEYLACVYGILEKKHDILNQYILTDKEKGFSKVYIKKIKNSTPIITEYTVIKENKKLNYSILNIRLHTGKTHQIRSVFSNMSYPLIGDSKYGKNEINKQFKKYKQLLIAYKYTFKFRPSSPLFYLNDKTIFLDKHYIDSLFTIE